jgi:hypothetical protein
VTLIEIEPGEAYYVELMSDSAGDKYYLSSAYGDISSLFTAGLEVYISDMYRKLDGALVEAGDMVRTLDGAATFSGGRTVLEVSDMDFTIAPGASLEVKGMLRIK